jgi:hypothetical protein
MTPSRFRAYENFHIVLWLLKDTCWVSDYKTAGLIMIVPTIVVALHITWLHRKSAAELSHNLAIVCWICANSVWMIGEFFFDDTLRPAAMVFFAMGLLMVAYYYGIVWPFRRKDDHASESERTGSA